MISSARRTFLRKSILGALAVATSAGLHAVGAGAAAPPPEPEMPMPGAQPSEPHSAAVFMPGFSGDVDHARNGFNPSDILTTFDYGTVTTLPGGQTLRTFRIVAEMKMIEVVPGIMFEAWTYNGRVPGPTIRCREGDRLRIEFFNSTDHPHTMHFHGIHSGDMDGVFEPVPPGGSFVYEFDAEPFGLHEYHCHIFPLAEHIARGLYGAFIIEPKDGWPKAEHEMVMVQNGIDIDFDGANDFYAVNFLPFHYDKNPIRIRKNALVRIFLLNMLEYDQINTFHLHGNLFHYYPTGTSRTPSEYTDTVMQAQAQRGILEFSYKHTGKFMFHAHKTEFAELGWTGLFDVVA